MHFQFTLISPEGHIREYHVEGTTYAPEGLVASTTGKPIKQELQVGPLQRLAEICAICNDSKIVYDEVRWFCKLEKNKQIR